MSKVNHPPHYNRGRIEVALAMDLIFPGVCWYSHAFKYAARAFAKGSLKTDLEKAIWCADHADTLRAEGGLGWALSDAQTALLVQATLSWLLETKEPISDNVRRAIQDVAKFLEMVADRQPGASVWLKDALEECKLMEDATVWLVAGPPAALSDQVREFQRLINRPAPSSPTCPDNKTLHLKLKLIAEEFFELLDACTTASVDSTYELVLGLIEQSYKDAVNLAKVADALADIDFVVEGMRQELGIDGDPIARLVAAANLTKATGPDDPVTGKRLKPPGFRPPDIASEIDRQSERGGA